MLITLAMVAHLAPPAAYDFEPARFDIIYIEPDMAQVFCDREPGDRIALGCAFTDSGNIFIRTGLSPEVEAIVLRHEKAHLNGWMHP